LHVDDLESSQYCGPESVYLLTVNSIHSEVTQLHDTFLPVMVDADRGSANIRRGAGPHPRDLRGNGWDNDAPLADSQV
jgi:hypothetical protein